MSTSTHISEDLPRLLTGDATRDEVMAAADHLRTCPDCQQELVSAVVAHASLTSAQRFAPEIVAPEAPVQEQAEIPVSSLPDMSAMFAKVREEASTSASASGQPAKPAWRRQRLLAVAAAAAVLAAGGVTIAETVGSGSSSSPSQQASRSLSLRAFDLGKEPAKVTLIGAGTMRIDATALPKLDGAHFYEVWLTDAARKRMQAVGSIGRDNLAQLTVSSNVMSEYTAIEVSVQRTDETAYSGMSVLRGSYG
jgi:hypothetical protein